MMDSLGLGTSQRDTSYLPSTSSKNSGSERGSVAISTVSGTTSSSTIFKGGREKDSRRYTDSLVDELDKSTHSQTNIRRAPMISERSESIRRSNNSFRTPTSGDSLDKSIHDFSRSSPNSMQILQSDLQKSKLVQSEKFGGSSSGSGGGGGGSMVDRFATLSQSAKGNQSMSSRHLATLDDKIDTLGQSLHDKACVRKVDTLSKSMHHTQSGKGLGMGTSTKDLLSQSVHRKPGNEDSDDDLPLMKTLLREASMTTQVSRRKSSYMDSTQTSLKIPSQYK